MGYGHQPYDEFVRVTGARSRSGAVAAVTRGDGPRWSIESARPDTLIFEYLNPLSARHTYGFSMEHMDSAAFGALSTAGLTARSTDRERASFRYNVAHPGWRPGTSWDAGLGA